MALTGHLEDLGLGEILHVIGAAGRSGILRVRTGGLEWALAFRRGTIVGMQHPALPCTVAELLERAALAPLEDPGAPEASGPPTLATLQWLEGRRGAGASRWLEAEIDRRVRELLAVREGTFAFELSEDASGPGAGLGAFILPAGIPHGRIALPQTSRPAPERPSTQRAARLLVPEEDIALPAPADSGSRAKGAAEPPGHRAPPSPSADDAARTVVLAPAASRRLLALALGSGELRKDLAARAKADGWDVRDIASLDEAHLAIASALEHQFDVAVVGQVPHAGIPGLELVARVKSIDRGIALALLADPGAAPGRIAAMRERAACLGAGVVALVPGDASAMEADDMAADLLDRLGATLAPGSEPGRTTALPATAAGADVLLGASAGNDGEGLRSDLQALARGIAVTSEPVEVAMAVLDGAGGFLERAILLLREDDVLRPVGAVVPHGDRPPASLTAERGLGVDGEDVLGRAARDGRPHVGPTPGDAPTHEALRRIGLENAARIAVIPLVDAGRCIAILFGDDAGDEARQPDLAPLLRFLEMAAAPLAAALASAARREEARRLRAVPT